ncbi:DUF3817 domain-containing protein [Nakamurella antarctica]|uniref:DUF3817 domain-containing protein n=1 Tax=Nakamurella antarctica TaxID=1902245 RepID=A0A3G8ZKJ4_9ACTN|nr:DUF3817 domain-containing protein [Nakamurella antarctica]AZI57365.1 DUF3817 domain-containing protein [Nakamurella antarctica]
MTSRIVPTFRVLAFVESLTWLGLLIGMYFKWIAKTTEVGVQVFGALHGAVFVAYVVLALLTACGQRWSLWTTLLSLAASIPPFFTVWFEVWAKKTGKLDPVTQTVPVSR